MNSQSVWTEDAKGRLGENRNRQAASREALQECEKVLNAVPEQVKSEVFPKVEKLRAEALGDSPLTVESCEPKQRLLREKIQDRIDAEEKRGDRVKERIISAMVSFAGDYPTICPVSKGSSSSS